MVASVTSNGGRELCGCAVHCGDDGDIDGPGTCKGLPSEPKPPLVEIVLVPKRDTRTGLTTDHGYRFG